jgi:PAS domain S-box-containing protein
MPTASPRKSVVLIVDDNPVNLAELHGVLSEAGYEVLVAKNGANALLEAERSLPELVVLDVIMPGMSGFEVCTKLKESPRTAGIPVMFTTALDDTASKLHGLRLGAVDYITKPFQHEEVLARVDTHLSLAQLRTELELRVELRTMELSRANEDLHREIAERKRYEEELRLRERAIEASSVGIVITDARQAEHPIIYANPAFVKMTGYAREELIGRNPRLLQGTATDPREIESIRQAIREGRSWLTTLKNYRKDGTSFWNEVFVSPVRDSQGNLTHYVGTQTDVTELKRAQEERHELEIARQIQLSLLPDSPLRMHGAQIAGYCQPASHVGGDYFDFFPGPNSIDIVIADVSGHSVGAALVMAETRSALKAEVFYGSRTNSEKKKGTSEILRAINGILYEDLSRAELFITMFYMRLNQETHLLNFSNAGHNKPLLWRAGQVGYRELDSDGLILGVNQEVTFVEESLQLRKGDLVLLYTDGITEAQNPAGEFFGVDRLGELLGIEGTDDPQEIINAIVNELRRFRQNAVLVDDITLIAVKLA